MSLYVSVSKYMSCYRLIIPPVQVLFIRGGKGLKTRGSGRCEASDWLARRQSAVNHRV